MFARRGTVAARARRTGRARRAPAAVWHVHWYRWAGEDPFSAATLYRCRCGQVRPGF